MESPRLRIRTMATGDVSAMTVTSGQTDEVSSQDCIPAKEWCISEDVLNVADSASFTVANVDGENAGRFRIGQLVVIDEQHSEVANGAWVRQFTGRVTSIETGSDAGGGSVIVVGAMDLGWHLTSSCAKPLKNIKRIKFGKLVEFLLDPTWGIKPPTNDDISNTRLRQGRQLVSQNFQPQLGAIYPYIQTEPGQTPWDLISTYAKRDGYLVNIGREGELIYFRPRYDEQAAYLVDYHGSRDSRRTTNNIIGRPTVRESIDGYYSETQIWTTVVIPPSIQNTEDPNRSYRHLTVFPSSNPLPFERRLVFADAEAINGELLRNHGIWKQQMEAFGCWEYNVEFCAHHQRGAFFASNSMISVDDSVNGVPLASYYVQRVQRSVTLRGGTRAKLLIRKPGLLNPDLNQFKSPTGGGAKRAK